jgi:hypothetical protein
MAFVGAAGPELGCREWADSAVAVAVAAAPALALAPALVGAAQVLDPPAVAGVAWLGPGKRGCRRRPYIQCSERHLVLGYFQRGARLGRRPANRDWSLIPGARRP